MKPSSSVLAIVAACFLIVALSLTALYGWVPEGGKRGTDSLTKMEKTAIKAVEASCRDSKGQVTIGFTVSKNIFQGNSFTASCTFPAGTNTNLQGLE